MGGQICTPQKQTGMSHLNQPVFQKASSYNVGYSKSANQSNEAHSANKDKNQPEALPLARVEQFNKDNNYTSIGHKGGANAEPDD